VKHLLAKSTKVPEDRPQPSGVTLPSHAAQVFAAANVLLDVHAASALRHCGLDAAEHPRIFSKLVRYGAFLHDWGKANAHFQEMVRGTRRDQLVRHEALSALLATQHPTLRAWLQSGFSGDPEWMFLGAVFAAAGHHLKFRGLDNSKQRGPVQLAASDPNQPLGSTIRLPLDHKDFAGLLSLGTHKLGLPVPPSLRAETWRCCDPLDDDSDRVYGALFDPTHGLVSANGQGARWWRALGAQERRLFALAKAWIVAADVAGSALAREDVSPTAWLREAVSAAPSPNDLHRVVQERLRGEPLRPFQQAVATNEDNVTLVEAGCGTGKTAAAYAWASQCGARGQGGKVFFAYPTTGTATEGFIGYVGDSDSVEASLIHGRASLDLAGLQTTREDVDDEAHVRSETLRQMESQVIVCTADTVLGLLQNHRKGLFLSPVIATGRFVFDEIHAYDDRMFAALLDFLRTFPQAPVLLMSASVPRGRRDALESVVGRLRTLPRPAEVEDVPRYALKEISDEEHLFAVARAAVDAGKRVLWVRNSVSAAIKTYARCQGLTDRVLSYHSRFRYEDRVERHRAVVHAFDKGQPACIAITTQVAEMSLDLSADVLLTDLAPAPSLVQRLGRLNRRHPPQSPCEAWATAPRVCQPYSAEEIEQGRAFWRSLAGDAPRSQHDLNKALHAALGDAPWLDEGERAAASVWLEGGPSAVPSTLRDASHTVTVLLEQDRARIVRAAGTPSLRDEILRCEVPINATPEVWRWERLPEAPFHPIAPTSAVRYEPTWGATWVNEKKARNDDHE
jgi:CRISPR-associated endonuclease/helicase Cas3